MLTCNNILSDAGLRSNLRLQYAARIGHCCLFQTSRPVLTRVFLLHETEVVGIAVDLTFQLANVAHLLAF